MLFTKTRVQIVECVADALLAFSGSDNVVDASLDLLGRVQVPTVNLNLCVVKNGKYFERERSYSSKKNLREISSLHSTNWLMLQ